MNQRERVFRAVRQRNTLSCALSELLKNFGSPGRRGVASSRANYGSDSQRDKLSLSCGAQVLAYDFDHSLGGAIHVNWGGGRSFIDGPGCSRGSIHAGRASKNKTANAGGN